MNIILGYGEFINNYAIGVFLAQSLSFIFSFLLYYVLLLRPKYKENVTKNNKKL